MRVLDCEARVTVAGRDYRCQRKHSDSHQPHVRHEWRREDGRVRVTVEWLERAEARLLGLEAG